MFDIDLFRQTKTDLIIVDCNGNGIPNSEVIYYKGDKNRILKTLVGNLLLNEVKINLDNKSVFIFKHDGFKFVGENILVTSGIDSLIYHGHEEPTPQSGVEWFYVDKVSNSIKIIRLLSTFSSENNSCYDTYFELINNRLQKWIDDLNEAIKFHNQQVISVAKKHAEYLHELYVNHPEMLEK